MPPFDFAIVFAIVFAFVLLVLLGARPLILFDTIDTIDTIEAIENSRGVEFLGGAVGF
ncbi:MAG: hypothetical protein OXU62_02950 [Gammaproteobacteria bacterium]|nr:hypothetical protein [Gammaproteobacteria bacterium]